MESVGWIALSMFLETGLYLYIEGLAGGAVGGRVQPLKPTRYFNPFILPNYNFLQSALILMKTLH